MEQINLNKNVVVEFTPEQIGFLLTVLRKQQYDQVVNIIASMEVQVMKQAREQQVTMPSNGATIGAIPAIGANDIPLT